MRKQSVTDPAKRIWIAARSPSTYIVSIAEETVKEETIRQSALWMDVILLLSSYSVAKHLPLAPNVKSFASIFFRVILFQTLVLFSLAILEVVAVRFSSLLLIFASYHEINIGRNSFAQRISILSAYRLTLWSLSVSLCIFPIYIGIKLYGLFVDDSSCHLSHITEKLWPRSTRFHLLPHVSYHGLGTRAHVVARSFRDRPLLQLSRVFCLFILIIYGGPMLLSILFSSVFLHALLRNFYSLGLFLSSTIDGIGSVLLPYKYLSGFFFHSIKEHDIHRMEEEYRHVYQLYKEKMEENKQPGDRPFQSVSKTKQWWNHHKANKTLISDHNLGMLQALVRDLQDDIEEMKEIRQMRLDSQTMFGKIKAVFGLMLSVVLILRIIMAIMFLPNHSQHSDRYTRQDPISTILLWFRGRSIISNEDYTTLSEIISLILSVFLSFSQIRTFLRLKSTFMNRFARDSLLSKNIAFDEAYMNSRGDFVLMLAFVMGCYFLSCVVLIKRSLPNQFHSAFIISIGNNWFEVSNRIVSIIFTVSSLVGLGLVGISFAMKKFVSSRLLDTFVHPHEKV